MKRGIRYFLFFALTFNMIVVSGCEDPVASMVKSTNEAAAKAAEIKSNEKIELEKIRSKERMEAMKLKQKEMELRRKELEASVKENQDSAGDGLSDQKDPTINGDNNNEELTNEGEK